MTELAEIQTSDQLGARSVLGKGHAMGPFEKKDPHELHPHTTPFKFEHGWMRCPYGFRLSSSSTSTWELAS